MKELIKGANAPLAATGKVRIRLSWRTAPGELDFTCFALDAHERVLADDWFVFYNQPASPGGAIRLDPQRAEFLIDLEALPGAVRKCIFIATLDSGDFRTIEEITFIAMPAAGDSARFRLEEPVDCRSLFLAELYRYNDVWKVRARGEGLKHGLAALAGTFGVCVLDEAHHTATGESGGASAPPVPGHPISSVAPVVSQPTPRPAANPAPTPAPSIAQPPRPHPASPPISSPETIPDRAPPPINPTDGASPPMPPYDRHEKLKTYATLAIAFGSLTTAITTLVTQCVPHAPVVLIQPSTPPPVIQQPVPTAVAPAVKPLPSGEKPSAKSRLSSPP